MLIWEKSGLSNKVVSFDIKGGSVIFPTKNRVIIDVFGERHILEYVYNDAYFSILFDDTVTKELRSLNVQRNLRIVSMTAENNCLILTFMCAGYDFKFDIVIDYTRRVVYCNNHKVLNTLYTIDSAAYIQREKDRVEICTSKEFLDNKVNQVRYYLDNNRLDMIYDSDIDFSWWLQFIWHYVLDDESLNKVMELWIRYIKTGYDNDYVMTYVHCLDIAYKERFREYGSKIIKLMFLQ